MNKFPKYQHFGMELIFSKNILINEIFVNDLAGQLINGLQLNVVNEGKYEFTNHGLTKFWVLSQSHLVIHTWPEVEAVHIDLMTCNGTTKKVDIEKIIKSFNPEKIRIIS